MTNNPSFPPSGELSQQFVPGQKIFNRYTLQKILGQGGMGVVWLAKDEELELDVALKFLPSLVVNDRASLNDLKRETRRSLGLTHPHIVRTYDFLQDGALAGISMEYVDSDTLRNRKLDQPSGVFQPDALGEWTEQLTGALDYAHKTASIVHRDLKPANLLINGRSHLKIADFGIARSLVESMTQVTGGNSSSGTLLYMSPQQLNGDPAHPLDDIYALGATLYELCTSRPPFYSGDITRQVEQKPPQTMGERRVELGIPPGEIPENWETTIAACLAKDPAQRPRDASEVAARLGLKVSAARPTVSSAPAAGPAVPIPGKIPMAHLGTNVAAVPVPVVRPKNWLPLAAAGAALGLACVVATVWLIAPRSDRPVPAKPDHLTSDAKTAPPPVIPATALPPPVVGPSETERLANARGSVFVESDPAGAVAKVDDRPAEKTPVPVKNLTLGTHTLKVTLDGYDDYIAQVDVKENQTTDVGKVRLLRSTGWLRVTTNPPGMEVAVKGPSPSQNSLHVTGPWDSEKIPVGEYEISATRPGWTPLVKSMSLTKDQSLPVAFDLAGGSVQITSEPSNATVLADGKPVGTTPFTARNVQPGTVSYTLTLDGYTNAEMSGKLDPGQILAFSGKLSKLVVASKPTRTARSTASTRSSRSRGDDDERSSRHEDGIDKASRAADVANKMRGLPLPPFFHP